VGAGTWVPGGVCHFDTRPTQRRGGGWRMHPSNAHIPTDPAVGVRIAANAHTACNIQQPKFWWMGLA